MHLTNVVVQGQLNVSLDLNLLANTLTNVRYDPSTFSGLIWQHRRIGGNCLVFSNGVLNCNGKCSSFDEGIKRLRRYARLLQKLGHCRCLNKIKVITASATHRLENVVRPENIPVRYRYEPELFPALMFRREGVHFTLHLSGSLIITGIKRQKDIDNVIYPVLVELSL